WSAVPRCQSSEVGVFVRWGLLGVAEEHADAECPLDQVVFQAADDGGGRPQCGWAAPRLLPEVSKGLGDVGRDRETGEDFHASLRPAGSEAIVQWSSLASRTGIRGASGRQPGLEV